MFKKPLVAACAAFITMVPLAGVASAQESGVTSAQSGDTLTVQGTGGADSIVVRGSGNRIIVTSGGDSDSFSGVTRIDVRTRGGNDSVAIRDVDARRVRVNAGSGNDSITASNVDTRRFVANGSGGNDTFIDAGGNDFGRLIERRIENNSAPTPPAPQPPTPTPQPPAPQPPAPDNFVPAGPDGFVPRTPTSSILSFFLDLDVAEAVRPGLVDDGRSFARFSLGSRDGFPDDIVDLRALDADTTRAGNQAFEFIGRTPFSGTPGELRVLQSNSTLTNRFFTSARFLGDIDGDGEADLDFRVADLTTGSVGGALSDNFIDILDASDILL